MDGLSFFGSREGIAVCAFDDLFASLARARSEQAGNHAFRMKNGRETSRDFILISDSDIGGPFETGRISLISPTVRAGERQRHGGVKYDDDNEHSAEVCCLI